MKTTRALFCLLFAFSMIAPALPVNTAFAAPSSRTEWTYLAPGELTSTPAVADIDGDGALEAVITSTNGGVMVLDRAGKLEWAYMTGSKFTASPLLIDLNSDGKLDVVAGAHDGTVIAIDNNRNLLWSFTSGGPVRSTPAAADINRDGKIEVLFGSDDNSFYALDRDGKKMWSFGTSGDISAAAALGDVNQDGKFEIAVGSEDGTLYLLDSAGAVVWARVLGSPIQSSPAMGDIDFDGRAEVVAASLDGRVFAIASSGSQRWSYQSGGPVNSSIAISDIDNNGELEVIFGCNDGKLYCLNVLGALKWGYPVAGAAGSPALYSTPLGKRIAFPSADGNINVINGNAAKMWTYPARAVALTSPVVADLRGMGEGSLLVASSDRTLCCVNTGESMVLDWPLYQHDTSRTGNLLSGSQGALPGSLLWSTLLSVSIDSSPALGDINGDGFREVVSGASDGRIYLLNSQNGSIKWSYLTAAAVYSSAVVVDVNGDGVSEIVTGSSDGSAYVLKPDGNKLWSSDIGIWGASPSVADIDGDGQMEVVAGTDSSQLYSMAGANGSWEWTASVGGRVNTEAALADLSGDRTLETVMGVDGGFAKAVGFNWSNIWKSNSYGTWATSPAMGDLDGDGVLDAVVGTNNGVYSFSGTDGSLLWNRSVGSVGNTPIIVNVPGGSSWDVVITADDGALCAVSGDAGELIWRIAADGYSAPSSADIDGDGQLELFLGTHTGLRAYSSTGLMVWNFPVAGGVYVQPSVSDINFDGMLEVVFGGTTGRLYSVSAGGQCARGADPWPCYRHDARRTGNPYTHSGAFLPDISLTAGLIGLSVTGLNEGTSTTVNVTVRNVGARSAEGFAVMLSDNGAQSGDVAWVSILPAASEITASFAWTPSGGLHILRATADSTLVINESREDNNIADREVRVNCRPLADAGEDRRAGSGEIVIFDGSASRDVDGVITDYNWSFGDGYWSRGPNPTHRFTAFGVYTVSLNVTDDSGAVGIDTATVTVNSPPRIVNWTPASDVIIPETGSQVFSVTVIDPENDTVLIVWKLDGVQKGNGTQYSLVPDFSSAGVHTLAAEATDGSMAVNHTWTVEITESESPMSSRSPQERNITLNTGSTQQFLVVLKDPSYTVNWMYDGQMVSGAVSPLFLLRAGKQSAGHHTVTAIVDASGHLERAVWDVTIFSYDAPPVIGTSEPAQDRLTVLSGGKQLFAIVPQDGDSPEVYIQWYLDGTAVLNATGHDFLFVQQGPRTERNVTVIASDGTSSVSRTWTVSINNPPVCLFRASQKNAVVKSSVTFDASASADADGKIVHYSLNFGDGSTAFSNATSAQRTFKHTFQKVGVYMVELRVTDDRGATTSSRITVSITRPQENVGIPGFELPLATLALAICTLVVSGRKRRI